MNISSAEANMVINHLTMKLGQAEQRESIANARLSSALQEIERLQKEREANGDNSENR